MNHKEAFMLMTYQCEKCKEVETIWNSRDGVTPFIGPTCRRLNNARTKQCGGETQHVNWSGDVYVPWYKPEPGERIWRDGTLDMMQDIMRKRVEQHSEYLDEEQKADLPGFIETLAREEHESHAGWPVLVEAHTGQVVWS